MKSTKHFLSAKPSERTDMVKQGYGHIAARMRLIAIEMKILNDWVKLMPGLLADDGAILPEDDEFQNTIEEYQAAGDRMTEAMVQNALNLEDMSKAIKFYQRYGFTSF